MEEIEEILDLVVLVDLEEQDLVIQETLDLVEEVEVEVMAKVVTIHQALEDQEVLVELPPQEVQVVEGEDQEVQVVVEILDLRGMLVITQEIQEILGIREVLVVQEMQEIEEILDF